MGQKIDLELKPLRLKLKVNWRISRNQALDKLNFILTDGSHQSEIAPNIRYGEGPEIIYQNFEQYKKNPEIIDQKWCQCFKNAAVNLKLKQDYGDFSKALNLKKSSFETSFSLPIMKRDCVKEYLKRNAQFTSYKIKIDHQYGLEFIREVSRYTQRPLRIDANEAFTCLSDYLRFESALAAFNIQFIEQPFPAKETHLYRALKEQTQYEIIADESILDHFDSEEFPSLFHGVNIKLMKAGGIVNAKELVDQAKECGLKTMVGCMIESGLGISEASFLAPICDYIDLDGALLTKNDPFQHYFKLQDGVMRPQF